MDGKFLRWPLHEHYDAASKRAVLRVQLAGAKGPLAEPNGTALVGETLDRPAQRPALPLGGWTSNALPMIAARSGACLAPALPLRPNKTRLERAAQKLASENDGATCGGFAIGRRVRSILVERGSSHTPVGFCRD